MELDKFDTQLLDLVQRNNRLSSEELGYKVGLSASGVQRRLKRMRSDAVIEADVAIVSPKAVGRNVTVLILISFERDRMLFSFKQAVAKMPEVMTAFYVTGQADCVLLVTAKDLEEYEQFTQNLIRDFEEIKRFDSLIVLNRIKSGFMVPLGSFAR
jgi:Lrp/AsnC family leucine-responsive transcriptional regulator